MFGSNSKITQSYAKYIYERALQRSIFVYKYHSTQIDIINQVGVYGYGV